MRHLTQLPECFPADTRYVLEARGPLVRRYLEFPDGRTVELAPRKAQVCRCQAAREFARKEPAQTAA